eukprot:5739411-Pleurochrysis_carterae.AAC.1
MWASVGGQGGEIGGVGSAARPPPPSSAQVLVSIQALVLCEQPYYNEAGYDKQLGTSEVRASRRAAWDVGALLRKRAVTACAWHGRTPARRAHATEQALEGGAAVRSAFCAQCLQM